MELAVQVHHGADSRLPPSIRKALLETSPLAQVESLLRSGKTEARIVFRANIVWRLRARCQGVAEIAKELGTSTKTVRKWRKRFGERGVQGLVDLPRSGRPPLFTAGQRCEVIAMACDTPDCYGIVDATVWTLDLLVEAVRSETDFSMGRSSIQRTLRHNALRPHQVQMWLHSRDPDFRGKVNRIVELYTQKGPEDTVVLCIDEKTGIQALERRNPFAPSRPGRPGRYEFEYIRHGTTSLLSAFNITSGHVSYAMGPTRKADDLVAFMEAVAKEYSDKRVIVIWDNLNIHHEGASERWKVFNERHGGRFQFVYTPLHASWVNQVEIFFSILARRCLKNRSFTSVKALEDAIDRFITNWNTREGHPFHWIFRGYPVQEVAA